MKRPIQKTTTSKIDPEKYANIETGELLNEEMPGIKSVKTVTAEDAEMVIMDSDEYVILDSKALAYIQEHFSPVDLGRIMAMTDMTYGEFNVLYNGRSPHTKESLMKALEYSRNKFDNFMKRLEKKSIIYYIVGFTDGLRTRRVMMNPHLARKRKTIHRDCLTSFEDIRIKKMNEHGRDEM